MLADAYTVWKVTFPRGYIKHEMTRLWGACFGSMTRLMWPLDGCAEPPSLGRRLVAAPRRSSRSSLLFFCLQHRTSTRGVHSRSAAPRLAPPHGGRAPLPARGRRRAAGRRDQRARASFDWAVYHSIYARYALSPLPCSYSGALAVPLLPLLERLMLAQRCRTSPRRFRLILPASPPALPFPSLLPPPPRDVARGCQARP